VCFKLNQTLDNKIDLVDFDKNANLYALLERIDEVEKVG
jgi:hypothetical protein